MFKAVKMAIFFAGFVLLAGVAVMLLWNALIPAIFDGTRITWIQALGLLLLARILVGGRSYSGFGSHRSRYWRERWESKLASMSPEERKKWKDGVGRVCRGGSYGIGEGPSDEGGPSAAKTEA